MSIGGISTKTCPDCGEQVPAAARKCRYCQRSFRRGLPSILKTSGWLGALVLLVLGSVITLLTPRIYDAIRNPLTRTDLVYMRPWDFGKLSSRLRVVANRTAESCIPSVASSDPAALRCFLSDANEPEYYVRDPCWPEEGMNQAACLSSPWDSSVTLVGMSVSAARDSREPVPPAASAHPLPWALELGNKQKCLLIQGATSLVAGMRINYRCADGYVVGDPDRADKVWTALYVKSNGDQVVRSDIRRAWA